MSLGNVLLRPTATRDEVVVMYPTSKKEEKPIKEIRTIVMESKKIIIINWTQKLNLETIISDAVIKSTFELQITQSILHLYVL